MKKNRHACVFLDRDGVINQDNPHYVYQLKKFKIMHRVIEALQKLYQHHFLLIVITNQAGISRKIYTSQDMETCHAYLQKKCQYIIHDFYHAPYHPTVSQSLSRKPGTLLFEKAIAQWFIDPQKSWMIGDKHTDILPAKTLHMQTIQITNDDQNSIAHYLSQNLWEATQIILNQLKKKQIHHY